MMKTNQRMNEALQLNTLINFMFFLEPSWTLQVEGELNDLKLLKVKIRN